MRGAMVGTSLSLVGQRPLHRADSVPSNTVLLGCLSALEEAMEDESLRRAPG